MEAMRVYVGSDHRGFAIKEVVKKWLKQEGYEVEDVGAYILDPDDDYVDYGIKVAESIEGGEREDRGILLCGSGHGMDILANRFSHVNAILGFNEEVTVQGREHEGANVLVLPANWIDEDQAIGRVKLFLETEENTNERYKRRRARIKNLRISKS